MVVVSRICSSEYQTISTYTSSTYQDIYSIVSNTIFYKFLNIIRDSKTVFLTIFIIDSTKIVRIMFGILGLLRYLVLGNMIYFKAL